MFKTRGYTLGSTTQTINNTNNSTERNEPNTANNDTIIFAIVVGNTMEVRRLVNSNNVNNIIDNKNNYTALHYAVKLPNKDIVEYLMSCGASTTIKQNEGKDAVDLSIEANKRYLIDNLLKKNDQEMDQLYLKYDDLNYNKRKLENENSELKNTNKYLNNSNEQYIKKIDELKEDNNKLKEDNVKLKRKLDDSEKAFTNLLIKNRKN